MTTGVFQSSPSLKIYARIKEGKELLGLSRATVYRRANESCFQIYKKNGVSVVKVSEVCAWLES
ncbi:AlpA family transcriptional regulator [Phaeobacter sp. 11ANDIMAR09]|uniref:helix-turn-helix transcriptional regulator n=1 Tax=Phaeobacter sp. 11ANDIMAR09 TaxID=1225647 RepID=UPI000AC0D0CD|nr:hypothetical protein [Phaeobacter sp. 11ANDIMAR09]